MSDAYSVRADVFVYRGERCYLETISPQVALELRDILNNHASEVEAKDRRIAELEAQLAQCDKERERLEAENARLRQALRSAPCKCTCKTHESDWPQSPHFKNICLFIKRLRQSGESMEGPGEQPCEKQTCERCAALSEERPAQPAEEKS